MGSRLMERCHVIRPQRAHAVCVLLVFCLSVCCSGGIFMPKGSDGMSKGFAFIEFKNPQVRHTAGAGQEQAAAAAAGQHRQQQQHRREQEQQQQQLPVC